MSNETLSRSIEDLRTTVDDYIDSAVANGQLTESRVNITERFGVIGSTSVETESGVQIHKSSNGGMYLYTEYLEGSDNLHLAVDVYPDPFEMTATETRFPLMNGVISGEVYTKTLPKRDHERVARELTKLIRQNF